MHQYQLVNSTIRVHCLHLQQGMCLCFGFLLLIIICVSYDFHKGPIENAQPPVLHIRAVATPEVKNRGVSPYPTS